MVNENVSLVISRQLLTDFCTHLPSLPDSTAKEIYHFTLEKIQPRVISFEEQVRNQWPGVLVCRFWVFFSFLIYCWLFFRSTNQNGHSYFEPTLQHYSYETRIQNHVNNTDLVSPSGCWACCSPAARKWLLRMKQCMSNWRHCSETDWGSLYCIYPTEGAGRWSKGRILLSSSCSLIKKK